MSHRSKTPPAIEPIPTEHELAELSARDLAALERLENDLARRGAELPEDDAWPFEGAPAW